MRSRSTRLLLAVYGVVALFLCGCNYVVLENPLPSVLDNRIVGSWATPDGKLYAVIKTRRQFFVSVADGGRYNEKR